MPLQELKSYIVYSSPAGTTRHVAMIIAGALKDAGSKAHLTDLGKRSDASVIEKHVQELAKDSCLWIGTPVYAGHAVPSVTSFISRLPEGNGSYAVPFVTWGAVTSGVALHEMGTQLATKGYSLLGAAKIGAVHSMMLECNNPLGLGHPDVQDDQMVKNLVEAVSSKIRSADLQPLPLQHLNYQPQGVQEWLQNITIEAAKKMLPPLKLIEETCTRCGICEQACPADAIMLDPYPHFGEACFMCYNCYRLCEENAIACDLSPMEKMLKQKSSQNPELPLTQVFV